MKSKSTAQLAGKQVVLYFVKFPQPGKVKTRLARGIGARKAADVYRELAEANLARILSPGSKDLVVRVMYDPPDAEAAMRNWLATEHSFVPQRGKNLTDRLLNAFQHAFALGARAALVLGSDTLGLEPVVMEQAFAKLKRHDVVLGPARDGGYYLVGLTQNRPELFQGIAWSTRTVLDETLEKVRKQKLSCELLQTLDDLDDIHNYEKVRQENEAQKTTQCI